MSQAASKPSSDLDRLAIDTIRTLSMDAVQKANSGHPGTPMALAPVAFHLWQNHLRYDPDAPDWPNRDRFVLSVGHASMLLYSLLFLCGVKELDAERKPTGKPAVSIDDIRQFRQLDSKTPGHPEYRMTTGVETTTGPLGQGLGNSVGMAMAARWKEAHFNQPDAPLFDYRVYALCGDGDMMEGVSHEAASLAGHLKLSNLIWIYDSNRVTIEGHTDLAYSDDVETRFRGYHWNTLHVDDANDGAALEAAFVQAKATTDRPTLIVVKSIIGWGAPHKQDTSAAHGEPLGDEEIKLAKRAYGWPEDAQFLVPDGVMQHLAQGIGARGEAAHADWNKRFDAYAKQYPELAKELQLMLESKLPEGWDADIPTFEADAKGIATRESSGKVLNAIAQRVPWMIGGAADLSPSTKTNLKFEGAGSFEHDSYAGRNLHFGIREHGMGRGGERSCVVGLAAFRVDVPDFQRLHEAAYPPVRHHGSAGDLCVHARFDRRRRGRPDAPADRAAGGAAWRPRPHDAASRRCERSRRGVACRAVQSACAVLHRRDAPAAADAGSQEIRAGRRRAARRLRAGRHGRRQEAASAAARDRQRRVVVHRGLREAQRGGHRRARRVDAFMGSL